MLLTGAAAASHSMNRVSSCVEGEASHRGAERRVQLLVVQHAIPARLEARILRDLGHSQGVAHALERRLRRPGDRDVLAVLGAVAVSRRGEGVQAAVPLLDLAELIEIDRLGTQQREQRLVERQIDVLPLAAVHVAPLQRDQRQKRAHEAGRGIRQAEGGKDWRLIGKAVDVGEAAVRLGQRAEARGARRWARSARTP